MRPTDSEITDALHDFNESPVHAHQLRKVRPQVGKDAEGEGGDPRVDTSGATGVDKATDFVPTETSSKAVLMKRGTALTCDICNKDCTEPECITCHIALCNDCLPDSADASIAHYSCLCSHIHRLLRLGAVWEHAHSSVYPDACPNN